MLTTLECDQLRVKSGTVLNLVVRGGNTGIIYREFRATQDFDCGELLEDIRQTGVLKSEEVLEQLSELLISQSFVEPIQSYVLDIGDAGRPSRALQDYYKYTLDHSAFLMNKLIRAIQKTQFTVKGPECDLHVLLVEGSEVLGHVAVMLDINQAVQKTFHMDIIGLANADFPPQFEEEIEAQFTAHLNSIYPDVDFTMALKVRRSELAMASQILLERS